MSERRRAGALVVPKARPPADRSLLQTPATGDHQSDSWRVLRSSSEFGEGFGTLDELFESLTLTQTGKIDPFPVVLFGRSYWGGLLSWLRKEALGRGLVSEDDLSLVFVTDDAEEAAERATQWAPVEVHAAHKADAQ